MRKKPEIKLSEEQRQELLALIKKGSAKARTIRRAHTLLMAADGKNVMSPGAEVMLELMAKHINSN
jgi:hypothetical protein